MSRAYLAAADEIRRRKEYEMRRPKWVEYRDDGEWLMVTCDLCRQPHARQRVLRFSKDALDEWHAVENARVLSWKKQLNIMTAWLLACFAITIAVAAMTQSLVASLIILGVVAVPLFFYVGWFGKKSCEKQKEGEDTRQRLLEEQGYTIPLEQVGTYEQRSTPYVILAKE